MTYCVAMQLHEGLVLLADSRTNAGVDNVSSFRKVSILQQPGDRVFVLMTAGNLATSQAMLQRLQVAIAAPAATRTPSLWAAANMYEAAECVGRAIRDVHALDGESMKEFGYELNTSCILAGQIAGERTRLFLIYPAGNFIESTAETPYFQIGESKYGKPIIDRVITPASTLNEAAKCALISMDSTIRSNLSVGLPLHLVLVRQDEMRVGLERTLDADDPYFERIRSGWGESLREAFKALPDPDWL